VVREQGHSVFAKRLFCANCWRSGKRCGERWDDNQPPHFSFERKATKENSTSSFCYSLIMKRIPFVICIVLLALILTDASSFIVHKKSDINFDKGWPSTISTYSTDGINGQVVYESSPSPDPYKLFLNFIFYLLVTSFIGGLASTTLKHKTSKSK
jgi:hypothetical protein